ncbi:MAG: helix-turn-helix domain-containing protein [Desulfuromonadaceae bacterium]
MGFSSDKLRQLRTKKAMTQVDLAAIAGVSSKQITRWESGKPPGAKNLVKLANALLVDVGYFFD